MSGGEPINLVLKSFRSNRSQFAAPRTCSYSRTGVDQNLTISACLFLEEALYFSSHRSLVGCPTQTQKQNNLQPLPSTFNFLSIQVHALLFPQHHIETIIYLFCCALYMLFPCLCWWPHHFIHSKIFKAQMHSPHSPPPSILSETIHSTWIILSEFLQTHSIYLIPSNLCDVSSCSVSNQSSCLVKHTHLCLLSSVRLLKDPKAVS